MLFKHIAAMITGILRTETLKADGLSILLRGTQYKLMTGYVLKKI